VAFSAPARSPEVRTATFGKTAARAAESLSAGLVVEPNSSPSVSMELAQLTLSVVRSAKPPATSSRRRRNDSPERCKFAARPQI
jgi:hypothetical protein